VRVIKNLTSGGSTPVLERLVQFTSQRHGLLLHNIANISTPNFRPVDVRPETFQQALADAVDARRRGTTRQLRPSDNDQIRFTATSLELTPEPLNDNLLFHDRNNRSLEHLMQSLAENTMTHNAAVQLLAGKFKGIENAIRGQV
jgi:flagellar basal-body rod protein FlgB